jgi:hypothetical protein
MRKLLSVGVAIVAAAVLMPTSATAVGPTEGEIDVAGAELAGTTGTADVNVFGTVRCATAGPLNIDVQLFQESTGGVGGGGSIGYTCPAPGDLVRWVVTADGGPFMVGDKVTITAEAAGSTVATDTEDHVLRWGR